MSTNESDFNVKLAKVMANSAVASKEEASRALEESGGNVSGAIALLRVDQNPSAKQPADVKKEVENLENDGKEDLQYAPSISTGRNHGAGNKNRDAKEKVKPSKNESDKKKHQTVSSSLLMSIWQDDAGAKIYTGQGRVVTSRNTLLPTMTGELEDEVNIQVFQGDDSNPRVVFENYEQTSNLDLVGTEHEVTGTLYPNDKLVSAEAVDPEEVDRRIEQELNRRVEEGLSRKVQQELEEMQRNVAIGEVVAGGADDGNDERQDESPKLSFCGTKRSIVTIVVGILALLSTVLGVVFTQQSRNSLFEEPTAAPTTLARGVIDLISSVSFDEGAALEMPNTPQNSAFMWLANNTNLNMYSDAKKIQRYALGTFYFSTNGDAWDKNTGWLTEEDECHWYSLSDVSFCNENGGVMNIDFYDSITGGNNLIGTIPNELALLSDSLRLMKLESNSLTGTIPTEIGCLTQLTYLDLSENSLTRSIPTEIGSLTQLNRLFLLANRLTGTLPSEISTMANVADLSFSKNSLTGTIPSQIGTISSLNYLFLYDNSLTGTVPSEIGSMTSLTSLELKLNSLTGKIPSEIGTMTSLTYLNLAINSLTGMIPSEIGSMTSLTGLTLSDNNLTGTIPSEIGTMMALTTLALYANSLTGTIPSEVGTMTALKWLYLFDNNLMGSIPDQIGTMTSLDGLYLFDNNLTGEFTCPAFIDDCRISFDCVFIGNVADNPCRSL